MLNNALPAWKALEHHQQTSPLRTLLDAPNRFGDFSLKIPGLLLDYSRQRVAGDTLALLQNLAKECDVVGWRDRMFAGEKINASENRAVLHTALRRPSNEELFVDGMDVMPGIHDTLDRMKKFTDAVHLGKWKGHTGRPIDTIINIGIGGSDLGPRMVVRALHNYHVKGLTVHFVSNVDGADLYNVLQTANPDTTLFLIASKTFTTLETMANARAAREWAGAHFRDLAAIKQHFVALSTNEKAVREFGISPENMFPFEDWVGGRYSLWSSIGLSIALATGFKVFRQLLEGAHEMDNHFRTAAPEKNAPILLALLGIWNRNFLKSDSLAVLPYSQNLELLPAWLQQADMESNGKHVSRDGETLTHATGPVVFGTSGTNCQHSYFQLIHQGTDIIPCDFIATLKPDHPWPDHHAMLISNMIAQANALATGRDLVASGNDPQRTFDGGRPSTILLLDELDPFNLGQFLALYEHRIFVQGIIWGINSFDQWGVELGKVLAGDLLKILSSPEKSEQNDIVSHIKQSGFR
ncbi:MAG: Glucose-6-phosphate isomerase [Micavibrio sp.]|nr:Glucose-6-phosphate isomerase [Micavibrio sp.]